MLFLLALLPFAVFACPPGAAANSQGKCLTLYTSPMTWIQAEKFCKTKGGHLASIHNGYDSSFTNLVGSSCHYYYIGAQCSNHVCHWVDSSTWNYNNWQQGEPGNLAYISVNKDNAQWKTVSGTSAECFICQTNN